MQMTQRKMARTPILYLSLGFVAGVIISRNAVRMAAPSKGAVMLGVLILGWFAFRAGNRGKAEAVAVATATATAIASSAAEANAKAVATQAVQIVLQQGYAPEIPHQSAIVHESHNSAVEAARDYIDSYEFSLDHAQVESS